MLVLKDEKIKDDIKKGLCSHLSVIAIGTR